MIVVHLVNVEADYDVLLQVQVCNKLTIKTPFFQRTGKYILKTKQWDIIGKDLNSMYKGRIVGYSYTIEVQIMFACL